MSTSSQHFPFELTLDERTQTLTVEDHWFGTVGANGCVAKQRSTTTTGTATEL